MKEIVYSETETGRWEPASQKKPWLLDFDCDGLVAIIKVWIWICILGVGLPVAFTLASGLLK